jgi:phage FluMu protein Com
MLKNYDIRKIKGFHSYTVKELAALFRITPRAVQGMLTKGLKKIDNKRPILIRGDDFIEYERQRRKKRRSKSDSLNLIYCVACKDHVIPHNKMVLIVKSGKMLGGGKEKITIKAKCPECKNIINRFGSVNELDELNKIFQMVPTLDDLSNKKRASKSY